MSYPTLNEPPEPLGAYRSWTSPEPYVRWLATVVYAVGLAGLSSTLGGEVSPWLGWVVVMVGAGVAAAPLWSKHLDHEHPGDPHE